MKRHNKAMREIRLKQEEARKKQEEASHREDDENLAIEVGHTRANSKMLRPGKAEKIKLSHFKLKTVLGRGGYGKVGIKGVLQDEM